MVLMMMRRKKILNFFVVLLFFTVVGKSQKGYWQQRANYKIEVVFDDKNHQYSGTEIISYINNSPDTLYDAYFHLMLNAFQPGSMMDIRSRSLIDSDPRVGDRISKLKPDEIGFIHVTKLKIDDIVQEIEEEGTILEVDLSNPIAPGERVIFSLEFEAQVPIQIRRNGRNSAEGVDYSMSQWYPKLSEYDIMGWNPNPYIGREFHGVWGDFDVTIDIDSKFVLGGSGVLVNADKIGYGYSDKIKKPKKKRAKWNFKAYNVHDFVWAADPDYNHIVHKAHDGTELHFLYIPGKKTEAWQKAPPILDEALRWINANYGKYPYPVYSFIQGGDGGMEYPMATLITGERPLTSLIGVSIHEIMHSWYQMILGTNESLYPWMDEGFTSFAEAETKNYLIGKKLIPGKTSENLFKGSIAGYLNFNGTKYAEPLSIHSDHFSTNSAYGVGAYTKGSLALVQLEYIVGKVAFRKAMLQYFNEWKFKHPTANDFFHVFEKSTRMELDWFKEYWVYTTKVANYGIKSLQGSTLAIENKGDLPMPLDILVTTKDGKRHFYYVPLAIMRGAKVPNREFDSFSQLPDWKWTSPSNEFQLNQDESEIKSIVIDPSGRLIDADLNDNNWPIKQIQP